MLKPWYAFRPTMAWRSLKARMRTPAPGEHAIVATAFGCRLSVDSNEAIGRALLRNEVFDIGVTEVLARLAARDAATLVDVGANIGYMAMVMAHFSPPQARVFAYEPLPALHAALRANIALNAEGSKVTAIPFAMSNARGKRDLFLPAGFEGNRGLASLEGLSGQRVSVEATTLDDQHGAMGIDVLKIDVEGHELSVLQGARQLLSERRIGAIVFEAHGDQIGPLEKLLTSHGYRTRRIDYDLFGLRVREAGETVARRFESPNYLAMIDPAADSISGAGRGWKCLRP